MTLTYYICAYEGGVILRLLYLDHTVLQISLTPAVFEVREDVGTVEFTLTVKSPEPDVRLPFEVYVDLETVTGSAGTLQL